jgi:hypothetical protein
MSLNFMTDEVYIPKKKADLVAKNIADKSVS